MRSYVFASFPLGAGGARQRVGSRKHRTVGPEVSSAITMSPPPMPKRRSASRSDHSSEDGTRRVAPYVAPTETQVQITNLAALLNGQRMVAPEQQSRLGFEGSPEGPRLWCAGDLSLIRNPAVAVVGTRDVSPEGAARARRLARELVAAGVTVVSGLARGVDTEALTAAIGAGGRVVAVIGTPIDKAYPTENRRLQELIYREHLLISQFEPGGRTFQNHFPQRNRLMAALTDASAIVEAGETSGTLHQATECGQIRALAVHWPKRDGEARPPLALQVRGRAHRPHLDQHGGDTRAAAQPGLNVDAAPSRVLLYLPDERNGGVEWIGLRRPRLHRRNQEPRHQRTFLAYGEGDSPQVRQRQSPAGRYVVRTDGRRLPESERACPSACPGPLAFQ